MRKLRDYDAELGTLTDKAKLLKDRKARQLGELVTATGADALPVEQLAGALLAAVATKDAATREGRREAGVRFFQSARRTACGATSGRAPGAPRANSEQRLTLKRARHDTRAWVVKRRERTRQLIELGGLVAKSGLVDLAYDDRAVILGVLIDAAAKLRGEDRAQASLLWHRKGKRAFDDVGA